MWKTQNLSLSPIKKSKESRKTVKRWADLSGGQKLHASSHLETVGDQVFHGEGLLGDLTAIYQSLEPCKDFLDCTKPQFIETIFTKHKTTHQGHQSSLARNFESQHEPQRFFPGHGVGGGGEGSGDGVWVGMGDLVRQKVPSREKGTVLIIISNAVNNLYSNLVSLGHYPHSQDVY